MSIEPAIARPVRGLAVLALCLAFTLFVLWPVLETPSWYHAKQAYRYPYLLMMFKEQFLSGHWYPRWLPGLVGGYGYPTFVYYPPGFWFFALPFSLFTADPVEATKAALIALLIIGGLGAYRLSRCFCSHRAAIIGTALFYLTPYIAKQIYLRGSLAELMSMMICPWVLFHLVMMLRDIRDNRPCLKSAVWLAISVAAIVFTHPMIAVWVSLLLVMCVVGGTIDTARWKRSIAISGVVGVLAAALSASYWYPALTMKEDVQYKRGLMPFSTRELEDLFTLGLQPHGLLLPIAALIGLCFAWRARFIQALLLYSLGAILYITWLYLPLRSMLGVVDYLQMPIRLLSVLCTLQVIGIALLLAYSERYKPYHALLGGMAIVILVILGNHPYYQFRGPLDFVQFSQSQPYGLGDMTHKREFTPRLAVAKRLQPRALSRVPIAHVARGGTETSLTSIADTDITLTLSASGAAVVMLNQMYFPGWKVEVDGAPAQWCPQHPFKQKAASFCFSRPARMRIVIPGSGNHTVHAWYDGPPNAEKRNAIALLVALISLLILGRLSRSTRSPAASGTR